MTQTPTSDTTRADMRKAQVLKAANECFRRQGFHNTSIVQISKAAGMSVGHIYHYFENKEAIIAGIVEQDLLQILMFCQRIRKGSGGGDLIEAIVNDVDYLEQDLNDQNIPLTLEIVAEAARNPNVARIIQDADETARLRFRELLAEALKLRGLELSERDIEGPLEVLLAFFEGFAIRIIRNPGLAPNTCLPALRSVVRHLLEEAVSTAQQAAA
ncbi:TetR family transcriptional regulator [Rhodocyclus tenuis]|uniref:TetR/AcrR family transcriptional regulator n=1 Tax=Rhodocyclus gracilis TaxID=2929842 RepID=UPI001298BE8C|nr:TetR/AcrR family transcriptional regulator [Rhodocyclus gracilis]MRD71894.1 TetR family transcriptional regulator [Rhodocyclus gracilis]